MKPCPAALALATVSIVTPGFAEDAPSTTDLEALLDTAVVSAPSKSAEAADVAPATSLVITAEELHRFGIRTLDEAINFLTYGMITERRLQTAEIGARGVGLTADYGSHVLLMVDGHVLNEEWGAAAYFDRGAAIPFELIDHIEVVLGPGSVLYGSNAMLGIVHVVTKRAKDYTGAHVALESELPVSLRGAAGVGEELTLFGRRAELVLEAEHFEQHGPVFDYGPQARDPDLVTGEVRHYDVNPRERRYPAGIWGGRGDDAYFTRAPAAYLRLRIGDLEIGARAALFQRSDPTLTGNFDDPDSFQLDRWAHLDVKHSRQLSPSLHLSTRLYGNLYTYREDYTSNGAEECLEGQDRGCLWRLAGAAQWVGLEPQLTLDWFEDGRAVTLFGMEGKVKSIHSQVDFFDNATGRSPGPVGRYSPTELALAAYLQQTLQAARWLALNAGGRLDIDDRFGAHASPRAAATFFPWRGGTLKAMGSEAFRAPTAYDIYYHDPDTQIPGGSALRPETVRSVEATVGQRFGGQRLEMGVFRSWWHDLLLLQDLEPDELEAAVSDGQLSPESTWGYQVQNVSRIESFGGTLGYDGVLLGGRLRYGLGLTEAFARREEPVGAGRTVKMRLAVAPQTFGNARVAYDLAHGLPTLAIAARAVGQRPIDDTEYGGYAEPMVEVRGTVSGPVPRIGGLSYRLTANWISAESGAYGVGETLTPNGEYQRIPFDRFRVGVGLAYDFSH